MDADILHSKHKLVKENELKFVVQNNELQQQLNSLIGLHSVADKEVELLNLSLEKTASELQEAKDKLILLTDENKIILQEKAILQGQFKQLQSSL